MPKRKQPEAPALGEWVNRYGAADESIDRGHVGELVTVVIDQLRLLPDAYEKLPAERQLECVRDVEAACQEVYERLRAREAAFDWPRIPVHLSKVAIGEHTQITAQAKVPSPDYLHAIAEHRSNWGAEAVLVMIAERGMHQLMSEGELRRRFIDDDQLAIPLPGQEESVPSVLPEGESLLRKAGVEPMSKEQYDALGTPATNPWVGKADDKGPAARRVTNAPPNEQALEEESAQRRAANKSDGGITV